MIVGLALVVTAFSVENGKPLAAPVLQPTFDTAAAMATMHDLATSFPKRSPGAASNERCAWWAANEFRALGLTPKLDHFEAQIPGLGKQELVNVSARVAGRTPTMIVVIAHRDNSGLSPRGGLNDNASGTAALFELARSYSSKPGSAPPQKPLHTIVFLSSDGGSYGAIGADRFANLQSRHVRTAAVIVLDSIAGHTKPRMVINGDSARSPAVMLTASAYQLMSGQPAPLTVESSFSQLLDLSFPFSLYEQAPFVARGIPAITLTTAGDRPPAPLLDTGDNLSQAHFAALGEAADELLATLDQGSPEPKQSSSGYIFLNGRFLPGWALQLLLTALVLPALIAVVDLFARCRRRHIPLWPGLRSLIRRLGFWISLLFLFAVFGALGLWPTGLDRPVSPETHAATTWPLASLVVFAFLAFAAWLVTRARLLPQRHATPEEELAGYTTALLGIAAVAFFTIVLNPYALLFLLPGLHLWIWLPQLQARKAWLRTGLLVLGLTGPLVIFWEIGDRLHLGFGAFWYVTELAVVGYVKLPSLVLAAAFAAVFSQLAALSAGRYAAYPARDERPPRSLLRRSIRRIALLSRRGQPIRLVPRRQRHIAGTATDTDP